MNDPAPLGACRLCGHASWKADDRGPVHPCCVLNARENPGKACYGCSRAFSKPASRSGSRRHS